MPRLLVIAVGMCVLRVEDYAVMKHDEWSQPCSTSARLRVMNKWHYRIRIAGRLHQDLLISALVN